MNMKKKYALAGAAFVLPSFLYYLFVFLYPLVLCFFNSFSKVNLLMGTSDFIGMVNYTNLFQRTDFFQSIRVTVLYVVLTVPVLITVALWVANTLSRFTGRFSSLLTTLVFLPFMVSMVSAGMVWDWLFDPNLGLINNILKFFHVVNPPSWLRATNTALISTVIITLWIRSPFSIMILLGGIKNVPGELYEAAELDGVNAFQRFFRITLPLINPQLVMVLTLETIFAFKAFDQIYVATGGGPAGSTKTIMIYLIKDLFNQNYGMASALTVLILVVLFCISLFQQLVLRKKVEF
ncbi:carbohydrate ABC transporter permease [Breznakiella homolactica]|uniref:Sugar ABC transporter permease n=1 Tax=Breznakiella homolactica TaxID=2798577 RepID=A0A7T8BBV9_9SPIR|nr:sugar ABC transporter permease [Breznakiella homolactica]QQO10982.1 sugar ABC transporter permease [Breznakiella homolactica]